MHYISYKSYNIHSPTDKLIRGDAHFDDAELWLEKGRGAVRR